MNRGTKIIAAAVGIIAICIIGGYAFIHVSSGLDSPLSVVMSSSMQHDNYESRIGIIDTGDVMVIQSPEKARLESYVEGTVSGYRSFGDYGSVIIYERGDDVNPVIHRAIIWLNYNGNGTWSAPSLQNYQGDWYCSNSTNYLKLSGTLYFDDITRSGKDVKINLDSLEKQSGYLTMGDNPETNAYFDQAAGIISHPVGTEEIRSVAMMEIPWLGVIKVYMTDGKRSFLEHVPNSINCLVMIFALIFSIIYCCDIFYKKNELIARSFEWNRWKFV